MAGGNPNVGRTPMRTLVNEAYDKTVELLRAQAELTVQREGARRTAQYLRQLKERSHRPMPTSIGNPDPDGYFSTERGTAS